MSIVVVKMMVMMIDCTVDDTNDCDDGEHI